MSGTPPSSPKRGESETSYLTHTFFSRFVFVCLDNNNIQKLKDRNQNGVPEIASTTAAAEDETDATKVKEALMERIAEMNAPQVC